MELPERTKIQILAPIVRGKKGMHQKEFERAKKSGYVRVRVDGNLYDLSEEITLDKNKKHNIEIVVDRLVVRDDIQSRLTDSLETAIGLTGGLVVVDVVDGEEMMFSQNYACPEHNISIEELNPRMFSFNNPFGACEKCTGLGTFMSIDPDLVIPDKSKSIREGAIKASGWYYAEGGILPAVFPEPCRPLSFLFGHSGKRPAKRDCRHPFVRNQRRKDQDGARYRGCKIHLLYRV